MKKRAEHVKTVGKTRRSHEKPHEERAENVAHETHTENAENVRKTHRKHEKTYEARTENTNNVRKNTPEA